MSDTIIRLERALMAVLQPLSGLRATGSATVSALSGPVTIRKGTYAIPLLQSSTGSEEQDYGRLVKVAANTVVTSATTVPIFSLVGGTGMNLEAGTRLKWDPPVAGVEPLSVIAAPGLTGGAAPTGPEMAERIVCFEGISPGKEAKDFWAAGIGDFPALVVAWDGTGTPKMYGVGRTFAPYQFRVFIVTKRLDGDHPRRDEGKQLLTAVRELIGYRCEVDGEVFSAPPTHTGSAGRLPFQPGSYIYFQDFVLHYTSVRRDSRTYALWKTSRQQAKSIADADHPTGHELVIVDQKEDMP